MRDDEKRTARAAFKEQASVAGIYAVRCAPSGQVWVGQSPNLLSVQNRIWFMLKFGNDDLCGLQAAWRMHGTESIRFEELERLENEEMTYVRDKLLKERLAHWQAKLGAARLWR
jgi:hypothetical protein